MTDRETSGGEAEIACGDGRRAQAEARRRQLLEPEGSTFEWIYLRNKQLVWVARRVDNQPMDKKPASLSRARALRNALLDNLHLEDLFLK